MISSFYFYLFLVAPALSLPFWGVSFTDPLTNASIGVNTSNSEEHGGVSLNLPNKVNLGGLTFEHNEKRSLSSQKVRRQVQPKINQTCEEEIPSPELWIVHDTPGYLKSVAKENVTTLQDLAQQNGVTNFQCGIGETCNIGQICAPVPGPAFQVFYAVQQWNRVRETFDKAVTLSTSLLKSIAGQLVIDLYNPQSKKKRFGGSLGALIGISVGVALAFTAAVIFIQPIVAFFILWLFGGSFAAAMVYGLGTVKYNNLQAFAKWVDYSNYISKWEDNLHEQISNYTATTLAAPLLSNQGLGPIIMNGTFYTDAFKNGTIDEKREEMTRITTIRLVNMILNQKKAFVTVESDKCDKGGPGGAFKLEDGWLSMCKNGRMANIIYAKENSKSGNHFYNHHLLIEKYNMTVEYMVDQAENCQRKFGGFGHDPYNNGTSPSNVNDDCLINIPVCYVKEWEDIHDYREDHGTVKACRKRGVPI